MLIYTPHFASHTTTHHITTRPFLIMIRLLYVILVLLPMVALAVPNPAGGVGGAIKSEKDDPLPPSSSAASSSRTPHAPPALLALPVNQNPSNAQEYLRYEAQSPFVSTFLLGLLIPSQCLLRTSQSQHSISLCLQNFARLAVLLISPPLTMPPWPTIRITCVTITALCLRNSTSYVRWKWIFLPHPQSD